MLNGPGFLNVFNKNFVVSGSNATNSSVIFDANRSGILLTTGTTQGDQVILSPNTETNQSPWNSIKWGTENELEWECALSIETTTAQVLAGLKLTSTSNPITDSDQMYFANTTTNPIEWTFVLSIDKTIYTSQIPGTLESNKIYKLRISIDNSRFAKIYINDIQYNITTVSGGAATAVTAGVIPSKQLKDDVNFIPFISIQADDNNARKLNVYYQKISRSLYE